MPTTIAARRLHVAAHQGHPLTGCPLCANAARRPAYVPTPTVAIVRHIGECDVAEIPDMRMPYPQALAELREVARVAPKRLGEFDLVYVEADGTLGRFASWQV